MDDQELIKAARKLGDKTYDSADDHGGSFAEKGLAITHEQAVDDYMEGTNDGKIDEYAGKRNVEIPETGYGFRYPDD